MTRLSDQEVAFEKNLGHKPAWWDLRRAGWACLCIAGVLILGGQWWSITLGIGFAAQALAWLAMSHFMRRELRETLGGSNVR